MLAGVVPAWRSTRSLHDRMRSRGVASEPASGRDVAPAVDGLPFSGSNSGNTFEIEGTHQAGRPLPDTDYRVVSPNYFAVLGIPLQRGRGFDDADRGRGVVVLSQTAAARFWPDGDPLESRVKLGSSGWLTVVGVVGDARYGALDAPDEAVRPMMYVPHWQMPDTPLTIAVRTEIQPSSLGDGMRRAVGGGDGLRVSRVEPLTAMVRAASATNRFSMSVVSAFAGVAITLALAGLYGLLALMVGRRTREIAVRFALGARTSDVVLSLLQRTVAFAVAGIAVGLTASLWLGAALRGVLFGIAPNDPRTYLGVALGFVVISVIVGGLAIRGVVRIDPIRALQTD